MDYRMGLVGWGWSDSISLHSRPSLERFFEVNSDRSFMTAGFLSEFWQLLLRLIVHALSFGISTTRRGDAAVDNAMYFSYSSLQTSLKIFLFVVCKNTAPCSLFHQ
jgi:hypothetical protein